jgi:NTP pyrophosphatase (non-canonical NTP hydrolase)
VRAEEYIAEVLRTYAGSSNQNEKLTLSALGLTGEAGEVADHIKKALFSGHSIDNMHLLEELGDVLWYVVLAAHAIDFNLNDVMQYNVQKLRNRYPNGFDPERSINR